VTPPDATSKGRQRVHFVAAFVEPRIAELAVNLLHQVVPGMTYTPCCDLDQFVTAIAEESPDAVLVAGPWLVNFELAREKCAMTNVSMPPSVACVHTEEHNQCTGVSGVDECVDVRNKPPTEIAVDLAHKLQRIGIHVRRSTRTRVVVAAEHEMIAAGIAQLVEQDPAVEVCSVATSSTSLIAAVKNESPQTVILAAPWLQSVEGAREILLARNLPEPLWLLTCPVLGTDQIERVRRLGVVRCDLGELFGSLGEDPRNSLVGKRSFASSDELRMRMSAIAADDTDLEILRLLVTGANNDTIARSVFLSLQTVKNRVSRLLKAAGAANRTELAVRLANGDVSTVGLAS
jgi:DNA-binding NarL/FixJ family response regulator